MHIALVVDQYYGKTGVGVHVRDLSKMLPSRDVSVTVLGSDVESKAVNSLQKFVNIKNFRFVPQMFFIFFALIRLHKEKKIDAIYCIDSVGFLGVWPFRKIYKVPVVFMVVASIFSKGRGTDYSWFETNVFRFTNRYFARRADKLICCSREMVDCMLYAGAKRSRIKLLYYPIDASIFYPENKEKVYARRRSSGLNCLFVGQLRPTKGAQHLLEAVPEIVSKLKNVTFTMLGDGPLKDSLIELSKKLGIEKYVFFEGYKKYEDLGRYFRSADVLIIPSLNEPLALVILQALTSGLPVIGTKVGGIPEVIKDGDNGYLVPPADSGLLAEATIKLLSDADKLREFSANALDTSKKVCSEDNVKVLISLFEELSKRHE